MLTRDLSPAPTLCQPRTRNTRKVRNLSNASIARADGSNVWIGSRGLCNRYLEHFRELRSERTSLFTRSEDSKILRRNIHQLSTGDF